MSEPCRYCPGGCRVGVGLCHCGCGSSTNLAKRTSAANNQVKGLPRKFIYKHSQRKFSPLTDYRVDELTECWEWQGAKNEYGYGLICVEGKMKRAHRVLFEESFGPLAANEVVRHQCDNPPCVNPAHLKAGSKRQNAQDSISRGRFWGPQFRPLPPNKVDTIIALYAEKKSAEVIAENVGCSRSHVYVVLRRNQVQSHKARSQA